MPENQETKLNTPSVTLFRRILLIASWVIAAIPLIAYLILLPMLPDQLPVKYDELGIPSINVAKTSLDMILYSLEALFGVFVMLLVDKVAQGFARRTYHNKNSMGSTGNTMAVTTLVIALLLTVSWFLTVIPLL